MMAILKHRDLWKSTTKLADKKGKWICGNGLMKGSQAYPEHFGYSVACELKHAFTQLSTIDKIKAPVIAKLRKQRQLDETGLY